MGALQDATSYFPVFLKHELFLVLFCARAAFERNSDSLFNQIALTTSFQAYSD